MSLFLLMEMLASVYHLRRQLPWFLHKNQVIFLRARYEISEYLVKCQNAYTSGESEGTFAVSVPTLKY